MEFLNTVTFAFIWPLWLDRDYDLKEPFLIDDYKIAFFLSKTGYFQGEEYVWRPDYRYKCMACAEANTEWQTSSFKPVSTPKQIPYHIEEELKEHVDNHVKLGTWGAMLYKRRHKCDKG